MKATFVLCINNSHNQPSFIWCFIAVPSGEFIFFYRRMSVLSHFSFVFMKKIFFCYFTVFEHVSSAVLCLSYNFHAVSHISATYRYSLEQWPITFENDRSIRLTNLLRSKPFSSKVFNAYELRFVLNLRGNLSCIFYWTWDAFGCKR